MNQSLKVAVLMLALSGTVEAANETYYAIKHSVNEHNFIIAIFPPMTNANKIMCEQFVYADTHTMKSLGKPARFSCKSKSTTDPRLIKEAEKAILE